MVDSLSLSLSFYVFLSLAKERGIGTARPEGVPDKEEEPPPPPHEGQAKPDKAAAKRRTSKQPHVTSQDDGSVLSKQEERWIDYKG